MRLLMLAAISVFMTLSGGGAVFADDGTSEPGETDTPVVVDGEPESTVDVFSLAVGGLVTADTGYTILAATLSRDRLGFHTDMMLDIGLPTWADGSSAKYLYVGGATGLRFSALGGGRGVLVGVALGGGYSVLTVTDGPTVSTVSDWHIGVVPQAGIRFGRQSGIFGEAIVRVMLPLKDIFIFAGDTAPETELEGSASIFRYQAVYMPSAWPVYRMYLGVGYSFSNC
jgi:hypothetical protein